MAKLVILTSEMILFVVRLIVNRPPQRSLGHVTKAMPGGDTQGEDFYNKMRGKAKQLSLKTRDKTKIEQN